MSHSTIEKYSLVLKEIRERLLSADILSEEENVVFIESTALQIRKVLELISYLSVLVNSEKLNHKEKSEWHPQKIIEALNAKTTIFYPLPSKMIYSQDKGGEPVLIPLGVMHALSQAEFIEAYGRCGKILHAQHPLKDDINIAHFYTSNKKVLEKVRGLLQNHTIAIRHDAKKYTFLYVEFDFTNDKDSKPTVLREIKTKIFNEIELKTLFEGFWEQT